MANFQKFCHVIVLGAGSAKDAGYPVVPDLLSFEYIDKLFKDLTDSRLHVSENIRQNIIKECKYLLEIGDDLETIFMNFEKANNQEGLNRVVRYYETHFALARNRAESAGVDKKARCEYLTYFLNALEFRDDITAVITFNHDCLIELMAATTDRGSMLGYCLPRELRFKLFPEGVLNVAGPTGNEDELRAVDFLKLHGSMNWVRCTACGGVGVGSEGALMPNTIFPCQRCGAQNSLVPLVVPPSRTKNLSGMEYLWSRAYEHLIHAAAVSFIGYSIPEYDLEAQQLFKQAFRDAQNLYAIRVINKHFDDKLKQRYLDLGRSEIVDFVEMGFKDTFNYSYW